MNNSDNIPELLKTVNMSLSGGSSIAAIEKSLGFGKDTLRRKLNRAGYKYHREEKRFLFDGITENKNTISNNSTSPNTSNYATLNNEHKSNTTVTQKINQEIKSKEIEEPQEEKPAAQQVLTEKNFQTLLKIIQEYELKEQQQTLEYKKDTSNVISRSFRGYKNVIDEFSDYCKKRNLKQKDALSDALLLFMKING